MGTRHFGWGGGGSEVLQFQDWLDWGLWSPTQAAKTRTRRGWAPGILAGVVAGVKLGSFKAGLVQRQKVGVSVGQLAGWFGRIVTGEWVA